MRPLGKGQANILVELVRRGRWSKHTSGRRWGKPSVVLRVMQSLVRRKLVKTTPDRRGDLKGRKWYVPTAAGTGLVRGMGLPAPVLTGATP